MSKEILEQVENVNKNVTEVADKQKAVKETADAAKKSADDTAETVKTLKSELEKANDEIKAIKLDSAKIIAGQKGESFMDQLRKGLETAVDQYKVKGGNIEVQLKTAISTANFTNDSTNNTRVIGEMREPGINKAPKRNPFVRELAFNGSAGKGDTVSWTEKVSESGVPIPLAELEAYPEETSSYQQFSTGVKKIGGMTKVAEEKLEDVDWMISEIQSELLQRHDLVVDSQLLSGDGTGNNLKGIKEYAPDFAAGSFAAKVKNANRADVLRVAYNQIVVALFQPTFIALHPSDVAFMELEKDDNGVYLLPPFVSANGMTVKGLPVVENTGITEGEFLMGDGTRLGVLAKGGAILEVGRTGNDFSTDQVTIKLRERLAARIKGRDVNAFVQGVFEDAIADILKP